LAREWGLSRKKVYLLEKKLSRIPGHLRHLRLFQLQIVQQHPSLSPEQFWRAYNEGNVDDGQFYYPQSSKLDVTGERSSFRRDLRGRPSHPAAPLAGYFIKKIATITGKKITTSRPNDSDPDAKKRPPFGIELDVIRCALQMNLFALPIPADETIVKWIRDMGTKSQKIPPDPPFLKTFAI